MFEAQKSGQLDISGQMAPAQAPLVPIGESSDLHFDVRVDANGYRWWYIDAFSDDGQCGLTIIIFIGCVFSPYYARARKRGAANPWDFCSINAIFYGPDRKRWALTERTQGAMEVDASRFKVGPSIVTRTPAGLRIELDEICVPFPSRLRGTVEVSFSELSKQCFALDSLEQHRWWPIAPSAKVAVNLHRPNLQWSGTAYVDSNAGTVPLESTFRGWHWTRTEQQSGRGYIFYNRQFWDGTNQALAVSYDQSNNLDVSDGESEDSVLPATPIWRCQRPVVCTEPRAQLLKTFEDTPFYARSKLHVGCEGKLVPAMHEYVDLARFQRAWVQTLLPFRMPRRGG